MPLFLFDNVTVEADGRRILAGVCASVPDAGVTVVVGPSGAGKSTLLRLCNRLELPTSGTVRFRGEDVSSIEPLSLRRRVGMVFQRPVVFGGTVRDNLVVALPGGSDGDYAAALDAAALDVSFLDRQADRLSGGEAQRVCLARTLVLRPEVLLMDEPTSSLDRSAKLALEELARAQAAAGVPVVWVTHELDQVERLADRVIEMDAGRVVGGGAGGGHDA